MSNKPRKISTAAGDFTFKSATGLFRCPCGGTYEADTENYSLIHSMEPCAAFLGLDGPDYLQWARENGSRPVQ